MPVKSGRAWRLSCLPYSWRMSNMGRFASIFSFSAGVRNAYIVHGFKLRVGMDLSRKKPRWLLGERHDADTVFHAIREYLLFTVALQHGIEILHGGDRRDGMCLGQYYVLPTCDSPHARITPFLMEGPPHGGHLFKGNLALMRCR